jgi:FKBP-type peptidyl-prolyl cis-trans isomerase FkpA
MKSARTVSIRRGACGLLAALVAALAVQGCAREQAVPVAPADQVATLEVADVVVGTGATAVPGSRVTVHYSGWLYDHARPERKGLAFDSSRDGGKPFGFELGRGQVIAGWDQGVSGMRVGGQRRLVIPADLAYGASGAGGVIPPGATLVFDVELLGVQAAR